MTFTVMISTRDRCADLERTCTKLSALQPPADETIICADGCVDHTLEMLQDRFGQFKVLQNSRPMGSAYSRDRMLRLARGDIVLSLDDDSYPIQSDFFAKLPSIFSAHPEAAVVVFPELRPDSLRSCEEIHDNHGRYVSAYANCAAAMRRSFYLARAGFPRFFTHMYEEPDYALQCYAAGAAVWFEPSLAIRHHVSSVNREALERHHLNARNELWSVWLRCPWPCVPLVSAYRLFRQLVYACSQGPSWTVREPVWWLGVIKGWRQCLRSRRPVDWTTYYHWMRLARRPIYSIEGLRRAFPQRCVWARGLQIEPVGPVP